jgi:hypothetical protein
MAHLIIHLALRLIKSGPPQRLSPIEDWSDGFSVNQQGHLTPPQSQVLLAASRFPLDLIVKNSIVGLPLAALAVLLLFAWPFLDGLEYWLTTIVILGLAAWLALLIGPVMQTVWERALLRRDVSAGRTETGDGECVRWRGRYVPELPGRRLRYLDRTQGLPPRHYRFCYLPHSHIVISGAPARAGIQDGSLDFTQQVGHLDLEVRYSNLSGRLSISQVERQISTLTAEAFFVGVLLVPLGLALLWGYAVSLDVLGRLVPALAAAFLTLVVVLGLWNSVRLIAELVSGSVDRVEGVIDKGPVSESDFRDLLAWSLGTWLMGLRNFRLGRQRLLTSKAAYRNLVGPQTYRMYYLPYSRTVVAVEPLGSPGRSNH